MANNKIQFKRTTISGRTPNTTNSSNNAFIDAGEFAVNLTDRKVYSSNGSVAFEVGANLSSLNVSGDVNIGGNLSITGTTISISGNNLSITDNMLYLNQGVLATITNIVGNGSVVIFTANNNYSAGWDVSVSGANSSTYNGNYANILSANATHFTVANTNTAAYVSGGTARGKTDANPDLGFAAGYNDGSYHHAGFFRDASDGIFKVFDNYAPEPDSSPFIDTANATFRIAGFEANTLYAKAINANGTLGTAGQGLVSNGTAIYWADNPGYTGSAGFTGSQGTTGFTGSRGTDGIIGVDGYTGSRGFTGSIGFTGSASTVAGPTGPQGPIGFTGSQGAQGTQGAIGYTGSALMGAINYVQNSAPQAFANTTDSFPKALVSVTITTSGAPVQIGAYGDAENKSVGGWGKLRLYRGSTPISGNVHYEGSASSENSPFAFTHIDNPAAGTHTYYLYCTEIAGGNTHFGETSGPVLNAIELQNVLGYTGSRGFNGSVGFTGSIGFTGSASTVAGPTGPTGPQGPIGFTGSLGAQGAQGTQGPIGFTGSLGAQGTQGPIGFTGSLGAQGPQGAQGAIGFTGSLGAQGAQGAIGFTGSLGAQGPQGAQGAIGFTGSLGAQGATGPQGPQGPIGFTGSAGATGPQGPAGSTGPTGPQGPIGYTGSWGGTALANVNMNGYSITNANTIVATSTSTMGAHRKYYLGALGASGTQARRYEIARIYIDFNDWHAGGTTFVELHNYYYYGGDYQRWSISYDYNNVHCYLIAGASPRGRHAQVACSSPVQVSGDYYYISVYVDVMYYTIYQTYIETSWPEVTSHGAHAGNILVYQSPSATNISDFTPPTIVYTNNSLQSGTDVRAPIFYDSDNTAYYVNPANTGTSIITAGGVYAAGQVRATGWWGDPSASATGLGVEIGQNGGRSYILSYSRDAATYGPMSLEATDFTFTGLSGGYVGVNTSVRAPIFYDSINTNYYVDPAGGSRLSAAYVTGGDVDPSNIGAGVGIGNIYEPSTAFAAYGIAFGGGTGNHGAIVYGSNTMYFGTENGSDNTMNSKATLNSSGTFSVNTDVRAPVFYDSDSTSYYLDPHNGSNLYTTKFNTATNGAAGRTVVIKDATVSEILFGNYPGGWTSALQIQNNDNSDFVWISPLDVNNNARFRAGGCGLDFYTDGANDAGTYSLFVGSGYATGQVSLRAPIFYDSDDTTYYFDGASTSRLNQARFQSRISIGDGNGTPYLNGGTPGVWLSYNGGANIFMGAENSGSVGFYLGDWRFTVNSSGSATASADFRAPVFYDTDDTNRYVNPNGTSQLVTVETRAGNGFRSFIDGASSVTSSIYFANAGNTRAWNWQLDENNDAALWHYDGSSWGKRITVGANRTIEQGNNFAHPEIEWSAAGSSTGEVIFYLPGTTSNYGMVHMVFDIYEYSGQYTATVIIGGHNWTNAWYNTGCNVIGYTNKTVRLGVKNDGTNNRFCVVFGGTTSSWNYGTIRLRKIHNGSFYDGVMNLAGNWSAFQTTTETFVSVTSDLRNTYAPVNLEVGNIGYAYASFRAPIFYDYDLTSFYIDPAGTSNINVLQGNGKTIFDTNDSYLRINQINGFTNGIWMGSSNIGGSGVMHLGSNGTESTARVRVVGGTYNGSTVITLNGADGTIHATKTAANNTPAIQVRGGNAGYPRIQTYGLDADGAAWMGLGTDMGGGPYEHSVYFPNGSGTGRLSIGDYNGSTYNPRLWVFTTYTQINNSTRSPLFYDSDNTGYYTDPASTSILVNMSLGGGQTVNGQSHFQWEGATYRNPGDHTPGLLVRADNATAGINGSRPAISLYNENGGDETTVAMAFVSREAQGSGNAVNLAGIVAKKQIAGDSGNWTQGSLTFYTRYGGTRNDAIFIDQSGYVTIGGNENQNAYNAVTGRRLMFGSADSDAQGNYYIGTNLEDYGGNYNKLDLRWHTGIRMGAQANYGGIRFYDSEDLGTEIFAVGKSGNFAQAANSLRAPIFYDSSDTAFYTDPASTSQIVKLRVISAGNQAGGNIKMGPAGEGASKWSYLTGAHYNDTSESEGVSMIGLYASSTENQVVIGGSIYEANPATTINFYTHNAITHGTGGSLRLSIGNDGAVVAQVDMRAPIFYDSNNTGYYVNPNGSSYLYSLSLSGSAYFQPNSWIQFNGSYGLYWPNTNDAHIHGNDLSSYGSVAIRGSRGGWRGIHFYEGGNTPHLMFTGANGGFYFETGSRWAAYYSYADNCWGFGTSSTSASYNIYCPTGIYSGGRVDGTIFYDSNDTGYYANPNSVSNFADLRAPNVVHYAGWPGSPGADANAYGFNAISSFTYANNAPYTGPFVSFAAGGYNLQLNAPYSGNGYGLAFRTRNGDTSTFNSWQYPAVYGVNVNGGGALYATIYYDQNNTGYYVDPNSTSNLYNMELINLRCGFDRSWENYPGIAVRNTTDQGPQGDFRIHGLGGANGGDFSVRLLVDGNVQSLADLVAGGALRAPIYYDSDNTGYYANPNGASQFSSVYANDWFRSQDNTGWYQQTHGGGIWMNDSTWVRVYNSKAFLVDNQIAATGNITAYYSDERLKTKTGNLDNALTKVKSLSGFTYIENDLARSLGYKNEKQQVGVSAQQVKAVLPEAVALAPVDYETLEDGTIVSKSGDEYLTVDYSRLVPLLIEAIKELSAEIEELKAR